MFDVFHFRSKNRASYETKSFGGRIDRVRVGARVSEIKFSATQKRVNKNKAAHIGIYDPWRHPRMITLNLKSTLISFFSPYISLWLRCRAHKYKHLNIPPCALAERAANFFNEGTARNMKWNSLLKKYSTRLLFVPFLVGCEQKSEIFRRVPGFTCEFRWNLLRKEVEVIVQVLIKSKHLQITLHCLMEKLFHNFEGCTSGMSQWKVFFVSLDSNKGNSLKKLNFALFQRDFKLPTHDTPHEHARMCNYDFKSFIHCRKSFFSFIQLESMENIWMMKQVGTNELATEWTSFTAPNKSAQYTFCS